MSIIYLSIMSIAHLNIWKQQKLVFRFAHISLNNYVFISRRILRPQEVAKVSKLSSSLIIADLYYDESVPLAPPYSLILVLRPAIYF